MPPARTITERSFLISNRSSLRPSFGASPRARLGRAKDRSPEKAALGRRCRVPAEVSREVAPPVDRAGSAGAAAGAGFRGWVALAACWISWDVQRTAVPAGCPPPDPCYRPHLLGPRAWRNW